LPLFLKNMDMFGKPLPSFNLQGNEDVKTHCGGLVSLALMFTVFMFASLKLLHLLSFHSPTINAYVLTDEYDSSDVFDPQDEKFMVAFSLEDYFTSAFKDNSKYVKWFALYRTAKDGVTE